MTKRTVAGLVGTGVWVTGGVVLAIWKGDSIAAMSLNEWGDFLAGFVAPIAFFWLILGYFQQGEELRLNTKALELQQDELRKQVQETAALVEQSKRQAQASTELLELEREQLGALRAKERVLRQPSFTFAGATGSSGGSWQITLRNVAAPVRDLTVETDGTFKVTTSNSQYVPRDGEVHITVSGLTSYPALVTFRFIDEVGEAGKQLFEIHEPGKLRPR